MLSICATVVVVVRKVAIVRRSCGIGSKMGSVSNLAKKSCMAA